METCSELWLTPTAMGSCFYPMTQIRIEIKFNQWNIKRNKGVNVQVNASAACQIHMCGLRTPTNNTYDPRTQNINANEQTWLIPKQIVTKSISRILPCVILPNDIRSTYSKTSLKFRVQILFEFLSGQADKRITHECMHAHSHIAWMHRETRQKHIVLLCDRGRGTKLELPH